LPETFYTENCLDYHRVLQNLQVDSIENSPCSLGTGVEARYLPGHSPDCLAVFLGREAVIVGDVVLPDITPWPTCEKLYDDVAEVLQPEYMDPSALFGLKCYLQSLGSLKKVAREHPDMLVLPAHRLYYNALWQHVKLVDRIDELIDHHIQRAGAIIDILNSVPKSAEEIARIYFDERLLKGFGSLMAVNEVVSHCELMIRSGDVVTQDANLYTAVGSTHFEAYIHSITGGTHERVA
jgi:glyoxylase-like metal-dependent hydrolase (beta-lactamase superfamily II)